MDPLVSIIVPSYNSSSYLPGCLASVLEQTYQNWECIIIDDGSVDETRAIVAPYLKDSRFTYFFQNNAGLSASRNKGIDLAKGDYIQMLDADDTIFPEKLQKQVNQLKGIAGAGISICDFSYSDPERKKHNLFRTSAYFKEFILRVSIPHMCFLFSRSCFDSDLRYDTSLHTHEDWDMMIRLFQKNPVVKLCPETLAWYRVHPASMTQTRNMKEGLKKIIRKHLTEFNPDSDEFALLKIRDRLNDLHSRNYKFPQSVLHSLLLNYAVWRYL